MSTAFMRALAAHDERAEIRGPDNMAELFLTAERRDLLKDSATRHRVIEYKTGAGMYEFMIARTAYFDRIVEVGLRHGLPQIVFLGAGFDSRPYRLRELIRDTRIYELDAPATQQRKREILQQAGIPIPPQVTFVSIDFETASIADALLDAGFDRRQPASYIWEGVTYYLSSAVVDETLNAIKLISAPGSSVTFDYAALSLEALDEKGVRQLRGIMKSDHAAEPTRFGIPRGTIESFLAARGCHVVEHLAAHEIESQFLMLRDGSSAGHVPALFCFVQAAVSG
jgi:methyltransferase (TIGR00027 family)